jgi:hypothetical protein
MKQLWIGTALAAALLAGVPAWAGNPAAASQEALVLSKEAYQATKKKIAAQHEADQKACARVKGAAKDVCKAQAEGRQKADLARLEARYQRSPDAVEEARIVTAEANYDVAREQCEALKRRARSKCVKEAKAAREAAIRHARVEKGCRVGALPCSRRPTPAPNLS